MDDIPINFQFGPIEVLQFIKGPGKPIFNKNKNNTPRI